MHNELHNSPTLVRRWCGAALLAALLAAGCNPFGMRKVSEGVYVSSGSTPTLDRAGAQISTARRELQSNVVSNVPLPELSVSVNTTAGLGLEDFRIVVEEKSIRVEGGGPAGALYGGHELARRVREGRPLSGLAVAHASPKFPLRIARTGLDLPGLSARPAAIDWGAFLDSLASARFNTLLASAGDSFPSLVRLARFPKAFAGLDEDAVRRIAGFKELLALADGRNIRLIVSLKELLIPAGFSRSYAGGKEEHSSSPLSRSYLKECISEFLQAYPQVRGVEVTAESLAGVPPGDVDEFARAVFVEGLRASGADATLYISADAAPLLKRINMPGIEVIREVELGPSPGAPPADKSSELASGRIERRALSPSWSSPAWCIAFLEKARKTTPGAFSVDLFDSSASAGGSPPLFKGESLAALSFGLSAFEPPFEDASWTAWWKDMAGGSGAPLIEAVGAASAVWPELARFHGGLPWSPLTACEASTLGPRAGELRDAAPYVSLLEWIFSRAGHPDSMTIPELVTSEARKEDPNPKRRTPLETADEMLFSSAACLAALDRVSERLSIDNDNAVSLDFAAAAAMELEAFAHLGAFHARRIRTGVFLLRHAAGVGSTAREDALAEVRTAVASWSSAEKAFSKLRTEFPGAGKFPDLKSFAKDIEADEAMVGALRSDPIGFRASPLFSAGSPFPSDFDFRSLRCFLDLGVGLLDCPAAELLEENQIFEAEKFAGTWNVLSERAGYSGTGYASSGAKGDRAKLPLTLRLNVRSPVTANVWVRALAGGGVESAVRLRAGGVLLKPTHSSTSGARRFAWERAGLLSLSSGLVFLQIFDDGPGDEGVDLLVLVREADWEPPIF